MNILLLIVGIVVPMLPVIMFPGKLIARGGAWKFVGAGLLVGAMMLVFWSIQGLTPDPTKPGTTDAPELAGLTDADLSALDSVFN